MLAALVPGHHHQPGGEVGEAHRALRYILMLPSRPPRPEGVDTALGQEGLVVLGDGRRVAVTSTPGGGIGRRVGRGVLRLRRGLVGGSHGNEDPPEPFPFHRTGRGRLWHPRPVFPTIRGPTDARRLSLRLAFGLPLPSLAHRVSAA
jgi:hypothetical protein